MVCYPSFTEGIDMPKYPPASGMKPEDLVKALVRHRPASDDAEEETVDQGNDETKERPNPEPSG